MEWCSYHHTKDTKTTIFEIIEFRCIYIVAIEVLCEYPGLMMPFGCQSAILHVHFFLGSRDICLVQVSSLVPAYFGIRPDYYNDR